MTQAVLPQFRQRRSGVIVNVTSTVTLNTLPLPLLSVYTASKAAINAFTDVIALELEQCNIHTRVMLPGRAPDTSFGDNPRQRMTGGFPEPYAGMVQQVLAGWEQDTGPVTTSHDVAEAIWQAVTDDSSPAHIPAGSTQLHGPTDADRRRRESLAPATPSRRESDERPP